MKTLLISVIAFAMPFMAGAQEVNQPMSAFQSYPMQATIKTPMAPTPSWHMIAGYYGPIIPAGWQVMNVESLIQNGTSVQAWLVYLYNPSTHQTAGWLIGLNP